MPLFKVSLSGFSFTTFTRYDRSGQESVSLRGGSKRDPARADIAREALIEADNELYAKAEFNELMGITKTTGDYTVEKVDEGVGPALNTGKFQEAIVEAGGPRVRRRRATAEA